MAVVEPTEESQANKNRLMLYSYDLHATEGVMNSGRRRWKSKEREKKYADVA